MRSVTSGILSGCSDLAGRRCSFRAPCGLFHTPAAVEPCRKTAKKCENGLRISQTAYHAVCFSTRFSTGCGKVLPSRVGKGKENVGLRRGGLPRLAAVVPGGGAWRFWLPVDFAAVVPEGVACFLCCLPTLPSVYFSAPYPPDPLPRRGRGRLKVYFAGGSAPGTPALKHLRHLQNLPSGGRGGFDRRLTLLLWCLKGGLLSLPPAYPAFSLFFCPLSPDPLPLRGRGSPRLFHARGEAPCIPGLNPGGTGAGGGPRTRRGCAFGIANSP